MMAPSLPYHRAAPMRRIALTLLLLSIVLSLLPQHTIALNFKISPKEELCFHEITHKGNKVLAFFDVLSWGYGAYVYLHVTAPSGHEIQKFEAASDGRIEFVAAEDGEHSFCFKNAYTETEVSFWINTETDVALADVAKEGKCFIYSSSSYLGIALVKKHAYRSDIVVQDSNLTAQTVHGRDMVSFFGDCFLTQTSFYDLKHSLSFSCSTFECCATGLRNIVLLDDAEHVNDMVYNVEKLNSLVSAARIDLEAFKAREEHHRRIAKRNRRRVTFWALLECLLIVVVAGIQVMRIRNFFEYKRTI